MGNTFIHSNIADFSTDLILQYLLYMDRDFDFQRINDSDQIQNIDINFSEDLSILLSDENEDFQIDSFTYFFYRRGKYDFTKFFNLSNYHNVSNFKEREIQYIDDFLHDFTYSKNGYSHIYETKRNNKISQLYFAKLVGLNIPETVITSRKKSVNNFFKNKLICVVKPISEHVIVELGVSDGERTILQPNGTVLLAKSELKGLKEEFFPSLFQEYIEKEFEVRSFYLNGKFYSMAIFSQNDSKTKVDFRNYNRDKPNRYVPFTLPTHVNERLLELMENLKLTTGSIDLVVRANIFYFLEVNPLGQFSWLSLECNYYLEKKIADHILKQVKNEG